jgi:hypothetical protein
VNDQYIVALSDDTPETVLGKPTTHSLLHDLTNCQARRMRGLDVLIATYQPSVDVGQGLDVKQRPSARRRRRLTISLLLRDL